MMHTPRLFALAASLTGTAILFAGCAQKKTPNVPANTTQAEAVTTEAAPAAKAEPSAEAKPAPEAKPAEPEMKEAAPATPAPEAKPAEPAPEAKPAEPAPEAKPAAEAPAAAVAPTGGATEKVLLGSPELTAGIPGDGPLTNEAIKAWLDNPKNHEPLDFELPVGLATGASQVKGIAENPLTRAKIELGRQLYFDNRLSSDVSVSCASCHDPEEGFAKHTQFGVGIKGQTGGRNSPVSYNRILSDKQFWDGRAGSLEEQAVGPIANPIEMGNTHDACVVCLQGIPGYKQQFEKVYGKLDIDTVGKALASFERAIVTSPTPFDYYEQLRPFEQLEKDDIEADAELKAKYEKALSDANAHPLSDSAKRGRELFFSTKANCSACHVGANLTDEKYHNIGVGMDAEKPDPGRVEFSKDPVDTGAFKTPTLRNIALTAPYMHDGSQKTLEEVVEWYAKGGHPNPKLSDKIKKLDLSDQDKKDLVEFMKQGLTSEFPKVARDRLPQ